MIYNNKYLKKQQDLNNFTIIYFFIIMNNMDQNRMNQMGMNNIGINPMFMNPLGINQIGMINNQQYFMNGINMDETAQNIKNIIQLYENKIRELEEIIRQKDFEIILLKQKLNNNIPNMPNINFMNIL